MLVGQMEATLEGQGINVNIRTSKVSGGELKRWPVSLADDCIYRPLQKEFEDIYFYDMTSHYKKIYKSYKPNSIQTYEFSDSHPGYKVSHLSKLKHSMLPRIALPQNKLLSLEEVELQHTNSTEKSHDKQEMYVKMALLMFYPYQKLNGLPDDGSYWKIFLKNCNAIFSKNTQTSGKRVFEILQNIEDRAALQKHVKPARDPISMATINKKSDKANKNQTDFSDIDQVLDILEIGIRLR
jgi:hypothetical protein